MLTDLVTIVADSALAFRKRVLAEDPSFFEDEANRQVYKDLMNNLCVIWAGERQRSDMVAYNLMLQQPRGPLS